VAVQLASEAPLAALVLEAPFTSIADVAAARIRWLLTRAFLRDRYDNLAKIGNVRAPTLIYGGSADRVIPPMQFVRLYDAVRAPRRLEVVEGATHDNAWERGGDAHVMHFLAEVLAGVGSASPVVR
jgi:pimeloyl-ACP methyl ester carboxylesterase